MTFNKKAIAIKNLIYLIIAVIVMIIVIVSTINFGNEVERVDVNDLKQDRFMCETGRAVGKTSTCNAFLEYDEDNNIYASFKDEATEYKQADLFYVRFDEKNSIAEVYHIIENEDGNKEKESYDIDAMKKPFIEHFYKKLLTDIEEGTVDESDRKLKKFYVNYDSDDVEVTSNEDEENPDENTA
jgi:hypothetical protein